MSLSNHRSGDFHDESLFSLFDIPSTKYASTARLKRWMMGATLLFKQLAEEQVMTGTASYLLQWFESSSSATGGFDEYMSLSSPFDIVSTKHASIDSLKRWRAAQLFKQLAEEQVMTGTASYVLKRFWEPRISHSNRELESSSRATGGFGEDMSLSGPFAIVSTKHASIDSLKRWRQSTLVLNPSRRFRYTLDLKKQEKKEQTLRKIRSARAQGMPPEMYLKREAENERAIGKIRAYVHMNK